MPPQEYQERLTTTLDSYFLACPGNIHDSTCEFIISKINFFGTDKWTKPDDDDKATVYDYRQLPSIF